MSAEQARPDAVDDFDFEPAEAPAAGGYRSPLMQRMASGKLTLELLRAEVPLLHAGRDAEEALRTVEHTREQRVALLRVKSAGEAAKERLMLAGVPLVKHLAQREYQRRQNWNTKNTFDDLFQEGMFGLLLGLNKYNPAGAQTSPTNYLGQWVLTTMKRNAEGLDNDFGVPYDAAERFRRIRALRSRLAGELGREPTDAEMVKAWDDPVYVGGRKIGRVQKAPTKPGKGLTLAQLAEERQMRTRVGGMRNLATPGSPDPDGPVQDLARPLIEETHTGDASEPVVERGIQQGLARLLAATLDEMRLPDVQREIVARRWGLPPHGCEESARDISRRMGLHRERVGKVIEAFGQEMARPGGAFHKICSALSGGELADLRLDWVVTSLGSYAHVSAADRAARLPEALTAAMTVRGVPVPPTSATANMQVTAQFVCDYHGADFVGVYLRRDDVPAHRSCPRCGRPSRLARVMEPQR